MKLNNKLFIFPLVILLTGCESYSRRVDESFGQPTQAVMVYAAQSQHANKVCGTYLSNESNERFYEWGIRGGLMLPHHREKSPGFKEEEELFFSKYSDTWVKMSTDAKEKFCLNYKEDVVFSESISRIRLIDSGMRFRNFFSIVSEEAQNRGNKGAVIFGAISAGLSVAGINQASKGNFSASNTFINYSQVFSSAMSVSISKEKLPCGSYIEFININKKINIEFYDKYNSVILCNK